MTAIAAGSESVAGMRDERRPGTRSLVTWLALAAVALTFAASGIVFTEPAPVDALSIGLIVLLPTIGLVAFNRALLAYGSALARRRRLRLARRHLFSRSQGDFDPRRRDALSLRRLGRHCRLRRQIAALPHGADLQGVDGRRHRRRRRRDHRLFRPAARRLRFVHALRASRRHLQGSERVRTFLRRTARLLAQHRAAEPAARHDHSAGHRRLPHARRVPQLFARRLAQPRRGAGDLRISGARHLAQIHRAPEDRRAAGGRQHHRRGRRPCRHELRQRRRATRPTRNSRPVIRYGRRRPLWGSAEGHRARRRASAWGSARRSSAAGITPRKCTTST